MGPFTPIRSCGVKAHVMEVALHGPAEEAAHGIPQGVRAHPAYKDAARTRQCSCARQQLDNCPWLSRTTDSTTMPGSFSWKICLSYGKLTFIFENDAFLMEMVFLLEMGLSRPEEVVPFSEKACPCTKESEPSVLKEHGPSVFSKMVSHGNGHFA